MFASRGVLSVSMRENSDANRARVLPIRSLSLTHSLFILGRGGARYAVFSDHVCAASDQATHQYDERSFPEEREREREREIV